MVSSVGTMHGAVQAASRLGTPQQGWGRPLLGRPQTNFFVFIFRSPAPLPPPTQKKQKI